jgi:hypothetical protein
MASLSNPAASPTGFLNFNQTRFLIAINSHELNIGESWYFRQNPNQSKIMHFSGSNQKDATNKFVHK